MYFQGWATPSAPENQFVGADWGRPASGLGFQIRQKIQLFEFKMYVFVSRYFLKFGFPRFRPIKLVRDRDIEYVR